MRMLQSIRTNGRVEILQCMPWWERMPIITLQTHVYHVFMYMYERLTTDGKHCYVCSGNFELQQGDAHRTRII